MIHALVAVERNTRNAACNPPHTYTDICHLKTNAAILSNCYHAPA